MTSATTGARCHRNMNNISLAISDKSYVVAKDVSEQKQQQQEGGEDKEGTYFRVLLG